MTWHGWLITVVAWAINLIPVGAGYAGADYWWRGTRRYHHG